jgi:hypothetical protein
LTQRLAAVALVVRFREEPRHEAHGPVAILADLHRNRWDLLQPAPRESWRLVPAIHVFRAVLRVAAESRARL